MPREARPAATVCDSRLIFSTPFVSVAPLLRVKSVISAVSVSWGLDNIALRRRYFHL